MPTPVSYTFATDMAPAVAGMPGDSGFMDKVTVPCGATAQTFGTVVAAVNTTGISVLPTTSNVLQGIALKDDTLAGRLSGQEGYVQYDPMTVLRRGRAWGLASGTCTKDAVAKYDPATGIFADAGSATYPNARFLSGHVAVPKVDGTTGTTIVYVELGEPTL